MRYLLTETAEADLAQILEFIAERDGLGRALHVHTAFVKAFQKLAVAPGVGTRRPHLTRRDVRWWSVFPFLVVYDASTSPLIILRVVHGARDLESIFS